MLLHDGEKEINGEEKQKEKEKENKKKKMRITMEPTYSIAHTTTIPYGITHM